MEIDEYKSNFDKIVNSGFICLAIGLGKNTCLFDVLKELTEPASITTIANRANLNERYVKEWLGCMVAANIVFLEGEEYYFIPEKLKSCLGSSWYAPFLPILAQRQDIIEDFFRQKNNNGEFSYTGEFGKRFYDWQDKERLTFVDERLDKSLIPTLQKYKTEDEFQLILDVGCGSGIMTSAFAKRYPSSKVIGMEYSEEVVGRAKSYVQKQEITNVDIFTADVTSLPDDWNDNFDVVIMFDVLHDLGDPTSAIKELKKVLKNNGILVIIEPKISSYHQKNRGDFSAAAMYGMSMYNCLPCSLATESSAGLGVGWGRENAIAFFNSHDLNIQEISDFDINTTSSVFILKKRC